MRKGLKSRIRYAEKLRVEDEEIEPVNELRWDWLYSQDQSVRAEYWENEKQTTRSPEQRLLAAMLLRACKDYAQEMRLCGYGRQTWFWFCKESDEVFGFRWVCGQLGLDPEEYRQLVRKKWLRFLDEHWLERV